MPLSRNLSISRNLSSTHFKYLSIKRPNFKSTRMLILSSYKIRLWSGKCKRLIAENLRAFRALKFLILIKVKTITKKSNKKTNFFLKKSKSKGKISKRRNNLRNSSLQLISLSCTPGESRRQ